MMKTVLKYVLLCFLLGLSSCLGNHDNTSTSDNTGGSGGGGKTPATVQESVLMGYSTGIPVNEGDGSTSTVTIVNNLPHPISYIHGSASYYRVSNVSGKTVKVPVDDNNFSLVNINNCYTIAPGAECAINVKTDLNDTDANQYVVHIDYIDDNTHNKFSLSSLISFSTHYPDYQGLKMDINSIPSLYIPYGNKNILTVPILLTKDFTHLRVSVSAGNQLFSPSLSCPGNSYKSGTVCKLYVVLTSNTTNPFITGNINIVEDTEQSVLKRSNLKSGNLKDPIFQFPITFTQNRRANLTTSASNITINKVVHQNSEVVSLFNSGNIEASAIDLRAGKDLSITQNNCLATLSPGASCSFTITTQSAFSGQSDVMILYKDNNPEQSLLHNIVFNVSFITAVGGPVLIASQLGSLVNSVLDNTRNISLLVKNDSDTQLNDVGAVVSGENTDLKITGGDCPFIDSTVGTPMLPHSACTITLGFTPTTASTGSYKVLFAGDWSTADNNKVSYLSSIQIPYTSVTGAGLLFATDGHFSLNIPVDESTVLEHTVRFYNAGQHNAVIDNYYLPSVSGLSINPVSSTCTSGKVLAVGEYCELVISYGPVSKSASGSAPILLSYFAMPDTKSVDAVSFLSYNSFNAAHITSEVNFTNALKESSTAYSYVNDPTTPLSVTIKYTNLGKQDAYNFDVNLTNMPLGYSLDTSESTCTVGGDLPMKLAVGESCVIHLTAVKDIPSPFLLEGLGLSFYVPGYSYIDDSTGVVNVAYGFDRLSSSSEFTVLTTKFSDIQQSPLTLSSETANTKLKFIGTPDGTKITVDFATLAGFINPGATSKYGVSTSCVIYDGRCEVNISPETELFALGSRVLYYKYYVQSVHDSSSSVHFDNVIIQHGAISVIGNS